MFNLFMLHYDTIFQVNYSNLNFDAPESTL